MAAAWSSVGLVAVAALVVGIAMPAAAAVQPPAPAPSSDGENTRTLFSFFLFSRIGWLAGAWAPEPGASLSLPPVSHLRFRFCEPSRSSVRGSMYARLHKIRLICAY